MSRFNRAVVASVVCWMILGAAALALRSSAAPAAGAAGDDKVRAKFEVYKDRAGEFRWRLRATNTQILATSGDSYKAKRDCLHAIESVKRDAVNAPVEDMADGQAQGKADGQEQGNGQGQPGRGQGSDQPKRNAR